MKNEKIWDIHDIGNRGEATKKSPFIESRNARTQDFYFLSATSRLPVAGIFHRGTLRTTTREGVVK